MALQALIAKKVGMTNVIDEHGVLRPVTILSVLPSVVSQIKTVEIDGYNAIQIAAGQSNKITKSVSGHLKKLGVMPQIIREFRLDEHDPNISVGQNIQADTFSNGDKVKVSGQSKGKGFAGTIKRHNFHRGRKTHGGRSYRRPGSIGSMYPQHIFKGTRMSGQMGAVKTTISNLEIAYIDVAKQLLAVFGSVPGPRKSLIIVRAAK